MKLNKISLISPGSRPDGLFRARYGFGRAPEIRFRTIVTHVRAHMGLFSTGQSILLKHSQAERRMLARTIKYD